MFAFFPFLAFLFMRQRNGRPSSRAGMVKVGKVKVCRGRGGVLRVAFRGTFTFEEIGRDIEGRDIEEKALKE